MSKVADLASFQLNTQQFNQTIQLGDINVSGNESGGNTSLSRSDSAHDPISRQNRAAQLKEFTNWLATRNRQGHHDPSAFISKPLVISGDEHGKTYRVDTMAQPSEQLMYQSPHFETKDYVEAFEVDNSRQPTVITDGFDPEIKSSQTKSTNRELMTAINDLKADGRVLGDNQQLTSEPNLIVPSFRWPEVSSNLLGSPALLNLENNIRQSLQTYRTQIVVTSTQRHVGASTIALSLARQLAERDNTVLVIDADLNNPSMANQLGLTTQLSWTQAIQDGRPTNQLIVKQKNSGVSLLPLIQPEGGIGESDTIFDNLATISNPLAWIYDFVVIDVGPASQYLAHSSRAKIRAATTLLVSDSSQPNENDIHGNHARLRLFGAENILMVQNFSRVISASKVG